MMGMVARLIWKRWRKEGDKQRKGKEMEMISSGI
jgi:hypothetical protein